MHSPLDCECRASPSGCETKCNKRAKLTHWGPHHLCGWRLPLGEGVVRDVNEVHMLCFCSLQKHKLWKEVETFALSKS
jgi:hypothetical protein